MKKSFYVILFLLLSGQFLLAQSQTIKVTDAKTGESIPYANIKIGESLSVISNAEGYFSLGESNSGEATTLNVSFLGYAARQITVGEVIQQGNTIALEPSIYELDTVVVSNERPDANTIMATVKKNLAINYKGNGTPAKEVLFKRESLSVKPNKLNIAITESTGYTKNQLKASNAELQALTNKLMVQPPQEFKDMLCHFYSANIKKNDKTVYVPKLEIIKATVLKNGDRDVSLDDMQKMGEHIFLKHLDTTKYYRIKSGWFGSHDTLSLKKGFIDKNSKVKITNQMKAKSDLMDFRYRNSVYQNANLDFINQPELYNYTYEGKVYNSEEDYVYILKFSPNKNKAKYTGKLYISVNDYAVIRCDYTLAEGKTVSGFNMKFLLGVKSSENLSRGTIIYKKSPFREGYYLNYASLETGQYIYLNRPLKFIELSEEEKNAVAFDLKLEGTIYKKTEYLNIAQEAINTNDFDNEKEKDFTYINLKRYDPSFWKGYITIEPLQEMKQFKGTE